MAYKNADQERANEFVRKLAKGPGASSDVILDVLTQKSPRRESEKAQGGERMSDETGKTVSPQRGTKI
jgi:hypothetical protein